MIRLLALFVCFALLAVLAPAQAQEKIKTLIVDGQNNHKNWPETTQMMKKYLLDTSRFTVDVATTAPRGTDADYKPVFKNYDLVVSNYNGAAWPTETHGSPSSNARTSSSPSRRRSAKRRSAGSRCSNGAGRSS